MTAIATIPLAAPYIPPTALDYVAQVLASGHLTEGPVTRRLEDAIAAFTGAAHAVAVTSCTTGLELTLRALELGPGDEVIVPGYTYPATAQAVMLTGACAVVCDVDAHTFNVDYAALEAAITPRTRALLPVSLFGNPLDWDRLNALAARHNLPIIEDAACGLGSSFLGRRTGVFGRAAVFSLHPRKSITTGEGGMIVTEDAALAARLRSLKRFGLEADGQREALRFVRLGTNLKLSDITAAVGLAQMEEADAIFARRSALAARYTELLRPAAEAGRLALPRVTEGGIHAWQNYCIKIPHRDNILAALRAEGIEAQIGTYALHREPLFGEHPLCRLEGPLAGCEEAYASALALPLFHAMTEEQQERVVQRLLAAL